jgi:hypothetical protein
VPGFAVVDAEEGVQVRLTAVPTGGGTLELPTVRTKMNVFSTPAVAVLCCNAIVYTPAAVGVPDNIPVVCA